MRVSKIACNEKYSFVVSFLYVSKKMDTNWLFRVDVRGQCRVDYGSDWKRWQQKILICVLRVLNGNDTKKECKKYRERQLKWLQELIKRLIKWNSWNTNSYINVNQNDILLLQFSCSIKTSVSSDYKVPTIPTSIYRHTHTNTLVFCRWKRK